MMFTVFVSIAAPIDGAISYFRVVGIIFSVQTLISIGGITTILYKTGFYPPVREYDPDKQEWFDLDEPHNFSLLTLSGVVMLSTYVIPFVLRPKDFFFNIG